MPPFWDTNVETLGTRRLLSQVPRPYQLAVHMLIMFFWNLVRMYLWVPDVLCSDKVYNCVDKPYLSRAVPQSYLRGCLLGYSPPFGSEKTLFYSYYRLFIDYLSTLQLLLLLSHFSRVQLCAIPEKAAHQAPPSLGFSRQEHWSGLPFPSPMHEREKWKWSRAIVSDS